MRQGPLLGNAVSLQLVSPTSSDSDNAGTFWPSHALSAILFVEGDQTCRGQSSGPPERKRQCRLVDP